MRNIGGRAGCIIKAHCLTRYVRPLPSEPAANPSRVAISPAAAIFTSSGSFQTLTVRIAVLLSFEGSCQVRVSRREVGQRVTTVLNINVVASLSPELTLDTIAAPS